MLDRTPRSVAASSRSPAASAAARRLRHPDPLVRHLPGRPPQGVPGAGCVPCASRSSWSPGKAATSSASADCLAATPVTASRPPRAFPARRRSGGQRREPAAPGLLSVARPDVFGGVLAHDPCSGPTRHRPDRLTRQAPRSVRVGPLPAGPGRWRPGSGRPPPRIPGWPSPAWSTAATSTLLSHRPGAADRDGSRDEPETITSWVPASRSWPSGVTHASSSPAASSAASSPARCPSLAGPVKSVSCHSGAPGRPPGPPRPWCREPAAGRSLPLLADGAQTPGPPAPAASSARPSACALAAASTWVAAAGPAVPSLLGLARRGSLPTRPGPPRRGAAGPARILVAYACQAPPGQHLPRPPRPRPPRARRRRRPAHPPARPAGSGPRPRPRPSRPLHRRESQHMLDRLLAAPGQPGELVLWPC